MNHTSAARYTIMLALVLAVLFVPCVSRAEQMTEQQVRAAVQTWVRNVTAVLRPDAVVDRLEPLEIKGRTVAYLAHLEGGGFCLAGADDRLLPVYIYSPRGEYDPSNPALRMALSEISERLHKLHEATEKGDPQLDSYREELARRKLHWKELAAGRLQLKETTAAEPIGEVPGLKGPADNGTDPDVIELPMNDSWHQGAPYNNVAPVLVPGGDRHAVTGCVPTAISQTMNFWKWPDSGVGSRSDGWYPRKYSADWVEEPLAINPDVGAVNYCPYDWAERLQWIPDGGGKLRMKGYWDVSVVDEAHAFSSDPAYHTALHTLYDNRLADVREWLSADFSAATYNWSIIQDRPSDPPNAAADAEVAKLMYHVGVAAGVRYGVCDTRGDPGRTMPTYFRYDPDYQGGWAVDPARIVTESQWYRPVLINGGGHQWAIFGYDKTTVPWSFWMNIGWGYNDHVLRTLDAVFPSNQRIDVQIAPAGVVKFVGSTVSGDGSPDSPYRDVQEALTNAPDDSTLVFKAGSVHTFPSHPVTLDRPMTLKGYDVTLE